MAAIKSEYACPVCEQSTGQHHQIVADSSALVCTFNGAHRWNDTESFLSLRPKMVFKVAPPAFPPQENRTPITLSVPLGLKEALDARFGAKTTETLVSILMQMVEGDVMIVGATDLERISGKLGSTPRNSSELFGMIYAKTEEVIEAKQIAEQAAKDLKAYEGLSVGRVVVDLGDQFGDASARARDANQPVSLWVGHTFREALKNNWF